MWQGFLSKEIILIILTSIVPPKKNDPTRSKIMDNSYQIVIY